MSDVPTRDYELAETVDADSPKRLKALGDPLRRQIVDLVLERAMSVTELSDILSRPKGTLAYHVDVLVDAGLLRVVRTRQVRAVEERFYGRVARTIVLPHSRGELPFLREVLADIDLDRMDEMSADPDMRVPGYSTYRRVRIPADRAAEYAARLDEVALEFVDEARDGDIEFGMFLNLFPTTRAVASHSGLPTDE